MEIFGEPNIEELKASKNVKGLVEALEYEHRYYVRRDIVEALGKIGEPAVEPLIDALKDKESHVRLESVMALGKLEDGRAVEPLIDALKDKNSGVKKEAAKALKRLRRRKDKDR